MFKSTYSSLPVQYEFQLQARCDRTEAYNLPDWYSFGNISPAINNYGNVAFKILGAWNQAIWYGSASTGRIVHTGARGACFSGVSLNNRECLVWEQLRSHRNGIWQYEVSTNTTTQLTSEPQGSCGWTAATLNDQGIIAFRAKFSGSYGFATYTTPSETTAIFALTGDLDASSIYSFLFLPSFNNQGQIAAKVRLGKPGAIGDERPDQIRIFDADGYSRLVVANQNHDADSPYQSFDNSLDFNDNGKIAFIATLKSGQRAVLRFDGNKTELIAIEGDGQLSQIERFPPRLNNQGLVIFRGFDAAGLRAIWAGNGITLHKVVTARDIVPTDKGELRLARPDNNAVFIGLPDLNDQGEIVFAASLADPNHTSTGFGAGLFVARS
ncbi:MAG: hypothetical protein KME06_01945 [Kastovskya adunca ATA6-11-RM4]|jgi:hypothetical protein|nr:hypothetical protein [Kastovskya adunca ATA6-11-RM4]